MLINKQTISWSINWSLTEKSVYSWVIEMFLPRAPEHNWCSRAFGLKIWLKYLTFTFCQHGQKESSQTSGIWKISLTFHGEKALDPGDSWHPGQEDNIVITQDNLHDEITIRHKITCHTNTSFLRVTAGGVALPEAPAVVFIVCVNQKLGCKSQKLQ